jgi:two-component system response regulator RegA
MTTQPFQRILIVDDDTIYRERLARSFREAGYETATAGDTDSGVRVARDFSPQAAVLDLRMPGDGLECLKRLIDEHPGIRAVILTGYGSIATAIEAVRAGAIDYLTKPADAEQILAVLFGSRSSTPECETYQPPSLERLEWEHIQRVLHDHGGNISRAAEALGLHRRSLQRKLQKYPPNQ